MILPPPGLGGKSDRLLEAEAAAKAASDSRRGELDAVIDQVLLLATEEEVSTWDRESWMGRSLPDLQMPSPRRLIEDGGEDFRQLLERLRGLAQLRQRRRSIPSTALGLPIGLAMAEAKEAAAGVRVADLGAHAASTFSREIDPTEWLSQPHEALGKRTPLDAARDSLQGFQQAWEAVSVQGRWLDDRRWRRQRLWDAAVGAFPGVDHQRIRLLVETPCREVRMRRMTDMCDDESGVKECLEALNRLKKSGRSL